MLNFYPNGDCFVCPPTSDRADEKFVSDHPTVVHYSPSTVTSILIFIRSRATQASLIRRYIQTTLSPIASSSQNQKEPTKTAQTFAEACRIFIGRLDTWVSELELAFVRGTEKPTSSTPLSLQRQLDERFGTMLDCLSSLLPYADKPNDLLNGLYSMLDTMPRYRSELLQVFITTAAPIWAMLGDWLTRGMPIPRSLLDLDSISDLERKLDPEFWVYRDQDVSWADEDFWEAAFLLRDDKPAWIDDKVLDLVLEAGKARGLLRGLLGREIEDASEGWISLSKLLHQNEDHFDLSETVSEHLKPMCQLMTFHLRRTLDEDCGLQAHLEAIDGLFYLRGFSTLQPWTEWLFSQVRPPSGTKHMLMTGDFKETMGGFPDSHKHDEGDYRETARTLVKSTCDSYTNNRSTYTKCRCPHYPRNAVSHQSDIYGTLPIVPIIHIDVSRSTCRCLCVSAPDPIRKDVVKWY